MALAGRLPRRWWLAAAPAFVGLAALFAFVTPYLFPDRAGRRDAPSGRAALRAARRGSSRRASRCRTSRTSRTRRTRSPPGFGPTRRVVLWSTLLDGRFSDEEVERRPGARARPPLAQPHPRGARLVRALRPARRLADRGRDQAAGRDAQPGRRARSRSSCSSASSSRRSRYRTRSRGTWRRRPTGWRSRRHAIPTAARGLFGKFTTLALSDPDPPAWSVAAARQPSLGAGADRARRGVARQEQMRATRSARQVSVYSGPEPPSGGVSLPPLAVIAPH